MRAGGENQVFVLQFSLAVGTGHLHRLRASQRRPPLHELHLAQLADASHPGGELVDDTLLECAKLVDVDLRLTEGDAPLVRVLRLVDHFGHVQQRLRRDAPAIEADAAGILFFVDKRDLHAEVGGIEGGRIAAGPCAEDHQLNRLCHERPVCIAVRRYESLRLTPHPRAPSQLPTPKVWELPPSREALRRATPKHCGGGGLRTLLGVGS
jgi:hypothetical protein